MKFLKITRFYGVWINFFRPSYKICWQASSVSFLFCCSWSWNRKSLQMKILGKVSFGISVWKMMVSGNSKLLKHTREKLLQLWLLQIRSLFVEFLITMETNEKTFSTLDKCWGWRRRPLCNVKFEVMNNSHNCEVNLSCCTNQLFLQMAFFASEPVQTASHWYEVERKLRSCYEIFHKIDRFMEFFYRQLQRTLDTDRNLV